MDINKLQATVIDALEDVKAQEITLFDTTHLTALFDRIAIASGTSNRQTKALAASVRDKVKQAGGDVISIEGEETGEWVLVDLGDMVVHIMQPAIRAYYRLEEIWGDRALNVADAKRGARSKRAATEDDAKPTRRRKPTEASPAEAPAVKPRAPRKTATKGEAEPAGKPARKTASKSAPKKTAAKKTPAGKTVKVTAARPSSPKKAATKRATVR